MALTLTYAIISNGVYSGLLGTLSKITINTCTTIKSIFNHKNPDINTFLRKLDIKVSLEVIESALKKKYAHYFSNIDDIDEFIVLDSDVRIYNDPEIVCLQNLSNVIINIHKILEKIDNKVERHKKKWFTNWRYLSVIKELEQLEIENQLLDKRFCMLRQIVLFMN